jgi:hypothetical protein
MLLIVANGLSQEGLYILTLWVFILGEFLHTMFPICQTCVQNVSQEKPNMGL